MNEVEYLDLEDLLGLVARLGVGPGSGCRSSRFSVEPAEIQRFRPRCVPDSRSQGGCAPSLGHEEPCVGRREQALGVVGDLMFLDLNGGAPELSDDEAFVLVWDVASGSVELDEIARRLNLGA